MKKKIGLLFGFLLSLASPRIIASDTLSVKSGIIILKSEIPKATADRLNIIQSIKLAAQAVTEYYGKFPVKTLRLQILQNNRPGISGVEYEGRLISWSIDPEMTAQDLQADWTLTHEMFHLGFPRFEARWVGEGMATYLEPIARARVGNLAVDEVWRQLIEGLPQGLPQAGDLGLNQTATWGRTYWGGALFWFLADLEIRKQTNQKKSLDTAIRAVWSKGGDASVDWSVEKMIQVADSSIGVAALKPLYDRLALHPGTEDLNKLWVSLGVSLQQRTVVYDNSAPLAKIRQAITAP